MKEVNNYLEFFLNKDHKVLANEAFNDAVSAMANYGEHDEDKYGHGKRIPYIGWFWRRTDFVNKQIQIGDSGQFIGVMENNKWDYPERAMTVEEVDSFLGYLNKALTFRNSGGNMNENFKKSDAVLEEMWDWFQTLKI